MQTKTMVSLFLLAVQMLLLLRQAVGLPIAMPNCSDHCGKIQIPYPFGIGATCYHDPSYEITCNSSFGHHKPFLRQLDLEVLNITWPGISNTYGDVQQSLTVALPSLNLCGSNSDKKIRSPDLKSSPYDFSEDNVLRMEGCEGSAVVKDRHGKIVAECASVYASNATAYMMDVDIVGTTNCFGNGCCQASIDSVLDFYEIIVDFKLMKSNSCNASVAVIEYGSLENFNGSLSSSELVATELYWKIPFEKHLHYNALVNVSCDVQDNFVARCRCNDYYEGNPYLPYGCQVVEECRKCEGHCNTRYNPSGYYCKKDLLFRRPSFLGFAIGMGVVLLLLGSYWFYRYVKKRKENKLKAKEIKRKAKEIKRKAKHFKRNGGMLLQQQLSSDEGVVQKTKIFTLTELEKATDNFNENRILGQGGQGTVYKGMLMDGKIVAIKKAKKVDKSQVEQFVNEVVILSQINHRNVVKLLGCCLETEVPVLVYEYIPNGTLYEYLQSQSDEFHVNWKLRLQIAAESAGAVAYLHSSSSAPIYHRDIKSTNILLDEKYRAKVSDFGISKSISIDQTHVTTAVKGTYGYLDPEYFRSNQFTEKSDVYSFGVVLVELITGKKPVFPTANEEWINLASEFLTQMKDSHLFEMLDSRIKDEGKEDEFMAVAELARKCLNMNGKQRPTMKEIAVQLDGIRSSNIPILKELGCAKSNLAATEVIYTDGVPFSRSVSCGGDDPRGCSIEIKQLMARGTTF